MNFRFSEMVYAKIDEFLKKYPKYDGWLKSNLSMAVMEYLLEAEHNFEKKAMRDRLNQESIDEMNAQRSAE